MQKTTTIATLTALVLTMLPTGCKSGGGSNGGPAENATDSETSSEPVVADVRDVSVSGSPGDYSFEVTVQSPDTGCDQYADWWEIVSTDGALLYRRILLHSHTSEQPFTRSGGPVEIEEDRTVIVRAHMSSKRAPAGYGGRAMRGSPADGFEAADLREGFGAALENDDPQPRGCSH